MQHRSDRHRRRTSNATTSRPAPSTHCDRGSMTTRCVRPGYGTAAGVAAAITELQGADRLGEVIVVVPPGSTAPTLRRLLPRVSGGIAGIRFLTPIDLAVELVDSSIS